MDENRTASYFEVVDLIDQVLPAKSELDYTKTSPDDLVKRFDEAIAQSETEFDKAEKIKAKLEKKKAKKKDAKAAEEDDEEVYNNQILSFGNKPIKK